MPSATAARGMPGCLAESLVLGEGDAAVRLDRLEAERAVGAVARQDDADGPALLDGGQRAEQVVDGHVQPAGRRPRSEGQCRAVQGHVRIGRQNIDVIYFDREAIDRFPDRHRGGSGEDVRQLRLAVRFQVHDEEQRQTGIGRQGTQQFDEGFQSAGGCADADHGKGQIHGCRAVAALRHNWACASPSDR